MNSENKSSQQASLALSVAESVMEEVGLEFIDFGCYENPNVPEGQSWVYEIYGARPGIKWTFKMHPAEREKEGLSTEEMIFDASQVDVFKSVLEAFMKMNELTLLAAGSNSEPE